VGTLVISIIFSLSWGNKLFSLGFLWLSYRCIYLTLIPKFESLWSVILLNWTTVCNDFTRFVSSSTLIIVSLSLFAQKLDTFIARENLHGAVLRCDAIILPPDFSNRSWQV
jgi:hypothetical protein